jgi:hypothetical protein
MDLVELGARSMDLVDLEFLELWCLANGAELFLWIWSCVELSQTRPKFSAGSISSTAEDPPPKWYCVS